MVEPVEFPNSERLLSQLFLLAGGLYVSLIRSTAAATTAAAVSTAAAAAHMLTFFAVLYIFVDQKGTISKDQYHNYNICKHFSHPLLTGHTAYKLRFTPFTAACEQLIL